MAALLGGTAGAPKSKKTGAVVVSDPEATGHGFLVEYPFSSEIGKSLPVL